MVLHLRDQDLIALAYMSTAEAGSDQVDGFGGAAREYDLAGVSGVHKPLHSRACVFVSLSGALAQHVHAPMNVPISVAIRSIDRLQNGQRLVACRGVV